MTYTEIQCWKCDLDILVEAYDLAERNYCQSCAWDVLALGRIPTTGGTDD